MISVLNVANGAARTLRIERNSGCDTSERILCLNGKKKRVSQFQSGKTQVALLGASFFAIITVVVFGAFYLYQVNDLATKGFEVQELEDRIQNLEKEQKKMEIREVELRSMYNLEKNTDQLNLVSPKDVTYLELDSPVAMNK